MILNQVVTLQWWDLHACVINRGFDLNKFIWDKGKKKPGFSYMVPFDNYNLHVWGVSELGGGRG